MPDSRRGGELFPLLQAQINRYENTSKNKENLRIFIFFPITASQFLTLEFFNHFFTINGVCMNVVC
jgi:hypothetical protein